MWGNRFHPREARAQPGFLQRPRHGSGGSLGPQGWPGRESPVPTVSSLWELCCYIIPLAKRALQSLSWAGASPIPSLHRGGNQSPERRSDTPRGPRVEARTQVASQREGILSARGWELGPPPPPRWLRSSSVSGLLPRLMLLPPTPPPPPCSPHQPVPSCLLPRVCRSGTKCP